MECFKNICYIHLVYNVTAKITLFSSFPKFPQVCVFFIASIFIFSLENFYSCILTVFPLPSLSWFIHFLQLFVCISLDLLKGFINFLFKDLYHLPIVSFKLFFLCFSNVRIQGQ